MSDFEDDFMDGDEGDFEYEEDDDEEEDVDLENIYYSAKAVVDDDKDAALAKFQAVVDGEVEEGKWAFKAFKQMFKLTFRAGRLAEALQYYRSVLRVVPTAVTRNESEKSINNMLDLVSGTGVGTGCQDLAFLEQVYNATLATLEALRNDRLWLKCNLKLAKLYLDRREYTRLARVLKQLQASVRSDDGSDDQRKGTQQLEILALEIQMYSETKNNKKLKELYQQCLSIKSAIPSPRIMGIIRECGGKMHMAEANWSEAQSAFFESFKNYDDAGSYQRIHVLKYLVLANMLAESEIDPFDSQETKPYKSDPEIAAMTDLVAAYHRRDIAAFEKILRTNRRSIMDDPFIREYIDEVLHTIRAQVIVSLIQPYTRIELAFIANQLNISIDEVEALLVALILDNKIHGKIDQTLQRLELSHRTVVASSATIAALGPAEAAAAAIAAQSAASESLYAVTNRWCNNLNTLSGTVVGKLNR
ncbi:hypothetical protein H9P43_006122 [Blastocladiella emersonii ATCC 22665]|nr:hypothetical protein H9P43_006122 [Blastocladiella emersonii ATCC 22665]